MLRKNYKGNVRSEYSLKIVQISFRLAPDAEGVAPREIIGVEGKKGPGSKLDVTRLDLSSVEMTCDGLNA